MFNTRLTMADGGYDFDSPAFDAAIEDDDAETTFIDDPAVYSTEYPQGAIAQVPPGSLQLELLQSAVNDYYNSLAEMGQTPELGRDYTKFELVSGKLRLKMFPSLDLVNARDGKPLALSTLANRRGREAAARSRRFSH